MPAINARSRELISRLETEGRRRPLYCSPQGEYALIPKPAPPRRPNLVQEERFARFLQRQEEAECQRIEAIAREAEVVLAKELEVCTFWPRIEPPPLIVDAPLPPEPPPAPPSPACSSSPPAPSL